MATRVIDEAEISAEGRRLRDEMVRQSDATLNERRRRRDASAGPQTEPH